MEVYSKLNQDELKRHGSFCGAQPPLMITSEGNSIRIVFTSDNSVQKTGFSLQFFTGIQKTCVQMLGSTIKYVNTDLKTQHYGLIRLLLRFLYVVLYVAFVFCLFVSAN